MSNIVSLTCKNCGGRMVRRSNEKFFCEYCETEFLIDSDSNNFDVVAGKLVAYHGLSTVALIPDTVVTIGENVFKNMNNIASIILPASVCRIENGAFEGCINLRCVDIPSSVEYIGDCAFKNSGLENLVISGNLKYLGNEAFMSCGSLREITVSGKIYLSGIKVFKQCASLEIANIPLNMFSASLRPCIEARKDGDKRPTFFDYFQGTPFFSELVKKYSAKECLYCGGDLGNKGICKDCGEKHYDMPQGCYVATCVYGSYDCPEVWTLRRYRDETLASTWRGRMFIRTYYAVSPFIVKWFGNTEWFKNLLKRKLDRIVAELQNNGVESTPYEDKNW